MDPKEYLNDISDIVQKIPVQKIEEIVDLLMNAYDSEKQIFLFGNGGSASSASHMACDLGKGTVVEGKKRFKVISLSDSIPLMTAYANDYDYEYIFSEQLKNLVNEGDIAFGLSGSGNSKNVLNALKTAKEKKAITVGLTGFEGGKMASLCDKCIIVPSDNMQKIEDLHLIICHTIFSRIRDLLKS
ncbi:MAG: SIS domain-containing protein [Candidatus Schekmanbacteria bacterium]|nr:MAG: SIS domain-containing protein [Candidatus Schekmanbacteria bacterium]